MVVMFGYILGVHLHRDHYLLCCMKMFLLCTHRSGGIGWVELIWCCVMVV